ncbi:cyclic nucleotide-gated ion channel 1 [Citrus sinensis]|uniref:Cyclic nucleotide-gated ion channel 1 n=1 Tax=Citrus sinensis TaxID=2711 RepID=A0ACB8HR36_CITSI|nr:cyclic nucleotide-gated ion channel 1 [Citrus sinensis]
MIQPQTLVQTDVGLPEKFLFYRLVSSAFGQNLETGNDVGENIFAICMSNYGVVLFVFLVGWMQSETARTHKINRMCQEIKQSKYYGDISGDPELRGKFEKSRREKLVNEFEKWSEKSLGYLCKFLKPVFFIERTRIIREGDPIDEMIFVLKGKLWTYSSRNVTTTTASNSRRSRENHLEDGDFFGKELIAWAQDESSSNLPISNKTIQALTDVEAFTLIADDLKHVLSFRRNQAALLLQSYWRFRELLRERRLSKNQA